MAVISSAGGLTPVDLEVIIWLVVGTAVLFAVARWGIRWYVLRLLWDDAAVAVAVLLHLSLAVMYRYIIPIMFELDKVAKGEAPPTQAFLSRAAIFLKLQFAIIVLFWTTVWVVKISFLIFYRNLFASLREHMVGWWITSGFTAVAYLLCWAFQLGSCVPISHYFILGACETPRDIRYSNACLYVAAAGDIISDLMIMGLGLRLLWNLQISAREKIALGAIFSVGFIKIAFAIIRVVKIGATARHVNPIWLALWSMIEASVAIVVASLPSFKVLFARGRRRRSEIRGAKWSKTGHWRSHHRHSNDMIEPLDGGIALDGVETRANGDEENQLRNMHVR
ncbi:MAG: hypothetical protein L6R38_007348 [Xanthoria sp. 2 TBL-2021]|nr:MAG: hypothetical protein L6R38_007348 [Xanthoria sp. 2 TBL-2021]